MKALLFASALVGAAVLSSGDAEAAGHANGFGAKGQLILSADRLVPLFGYAHESVDKGDNNNVSTSTSSSEISLLFSHPGSANNLLLDVHSVPRVAADFTVINNLTIGLGVGFLFGLGGSTKTTTQNGATTVTTSVDAPTGTMIGLAPRIGYIIPLGEHLAFWPRGGFAFYSVNETRKTADTTNGNTVNSSIEVTNTALSLDLDPQLVIIPAEHFFFTVGPTLNIPLTGSVSTTTTTGVNSIETSQDSSILHFGINASIGGWVNLF